VSEQPHHFVLVRVALPHHLRTLAQVTTSEIELQVACPPLTQCTLLDALEARFPALRGTIRDRDTLRRRAFLRFFACGEDLSLEPPDAPLPAAVAQGTEPFLIIAAIAGG
jgi:hypothetical protein